MDNSTALAVAGATGALAPPGYELTRKTCALCKCELPAGEFYRRKEGRLSAYCKPCTRAKSKAAQLSDHGKALRAEYRKRNAAKLNQAIREHRQANPEPKREYDKQYRQANLESLKLEARSRYQQNPAPYIARAKARAQANPEAEKIRQRVRSAKRRGSLVDANAIWYFYVLRRDPCSYCGVRMARAEIDHMLPISKGGVTDIYNMTAACPSCNKAKHTKTPLHFLLERCANG